jgi:hypothetical protein
MRAWVINSFYFGYRSPIRLRNNFINPIRNEYFGSEIRTNPIGFGSVSDRICTPLITRQLVLILFYYHALNDDK